VLRRCGYEPSLDRTASCGSTTARSIRCDTTTTWCAGSTLPTSAGCLTGSVPPPWRSRLSRGLVSAVSK
jgi:hypothetical protein